MNQLINEDCSVVEQSPRIRWTISNLLVLTTVSAVVVSTSIWLGKNYSLLSAFPGLPILMVLAMTRMRSWRGAMIGATIFAFLAVSVVVQFERHDPRFLKAVVLLSLYGAAFGVSVSAFRLGHYWLGSVVFMIAFILLTATSMIIA